MATTTKFERIAFLNRWKLKKYSRNCDWTIIGISVWWSSPESYCYKFCFFGFEVNLWFERIFK